MKRAAALSVLRAHEAELKRLGVERLYLFGSTARDDAGADSDVDLFFDHPEGSLGLFALMSVKEAASRILGRRADVMTRRGLHPVLRPEIEASARRVFRAMAKAHVARLTDLVEAIVLIQAEMTASRRLQRRKRSP